MLLPPPPLAHAAVGTEPGRHAPTQIRQRKGPDAVTSVERSEQSVESLILRDRKQLAGTGHPVRSAKPKLKMPISPMKDDHTGGDEPPRGGIVPVSAMQ